MNCINALFANTKKTEKRQFHVWSVPQLILAAAAHLFRVEAAVSAEEAVAATLAVAVSAVAVLQAAGKTN